MSPAERIAEAWGEEYAQPRQDLSPRQRRVATAQALLDAGAIRAPVAPEPRVLSQLPVDPATVAGWLQLPIDPEAL